MKEILVSTQQPYSVKIGDHLLPTLGIEAKTVAKGTHAVIVSDSNVWPLYGEIARKVLSYSGFSVDFFVFPAGEVHKNGITYLNLLNFLAEHRITRSDFLIALGGGVVGDLCGFAAATYLRGVDYIQVPTTLLSMVDSSVGGKTAIDLPAGKNLAGAFYQPKLVLCDTSLLQTLPNDLFLDGCAEVIKYGILFDKDLYHHLEINDVSFDKEYVITRCIELKRNVVQEDEFDHDQRQLLNLGHTFAHGIEKESRYSISHGTAVAIGLCMAARSSRQFGFCDEETARQIQTLVSQFGLPTATSFSASALAGHALSDKKRHNDQITMVLPSTIGCCRLHKFPVSDLENVMKAGV